MYYLISTIANGRSSMRFVHTFDDLEYAKLCMDANLRSAGLTEMTAALFSIERALSRHERVELRNAVPLDAQVVRSTGPVGDLHRLSRCHLESIHRDAMDLPIRIGQSRELVVA